MNTGGDFLPCGDLLITVHATGTVEPEETVDVGAQVVGRIKELGKDPRGVSNQSFAEKPVDYETAINDKANSKKGEPAGNGAPALNNQTAGSPADHEQKELVTNSTGKSNAHPAGSAAAASTDPEAHVATNAEHIVADPAFAGKTVDYGSPVIEGMVLAQIDPAIYKAQFDQASAALEQANARVLQAEAMVAQTTAEWDRAQRLRNLKITSRSPTGTGNDDLMLPIKGISDADYVLAQANAASAKADLEAAKAAVLQQKATLALARTNLNYTTIVSPIDGTIIARRVNIGQTVVSSLNAPSLFLIARDLRRMQVWAAVNEADIAKVTPGTKVHFSVDALPEDTFRGTVVQRRLNASMTQNVVTYTVVIDVDNSDLKLLPYLTADVHFEVDNRKDVLLVSNAALRYKPNPSFIDHGAEESTADPSSGEVSRRNPLEKNKEKATTVGRLWVVNPESKKLRPVEVQLGLSDSSTSLTEITGGDIKEGDEIVTGENLQLQTGGSSDVTNPLAPPRFRGNRSQPKHPG